MNRKDRQMNEDFGFEVFDKVLYATLSLVDKEGNPYCIPVSPVRKDRDTIYLHSSKVGEKIECIKNNNKICLSMVSYAKLVPNKFTTEYNSAIIKGHASMVSSDDEKIEALRLICERYAKDNMDNFQDSIKRSLFRTEIIKIKIEEITSKRKKYDKNGEEMKWGRTE